MHNIIHFYSCITDGEVGQPRAVLADAPSLHHCGDSNGDGHRGPPASWVHNFGQSGNSARIVGIGVRG